MSDDRDDRLHTVPITEQIMARVQDAVDEVDPAGPKEPPRPPPEPDAPLEIEAIPERPPAPPLPPTEAELARGRSRRRRILVSAVVFLVGAAAFVGFTDIGRGLLPTHLQGQAKTLADDVERRAREATTDRFYTFTDDDGVVHIVDALDKVPPRYRSRAEETR